MKITDHTSALFGNIHQLRVHVFITSDATIARPFISLSWSYSESTNTICFTSPSSPSFFFHFSPTSTINAFISKLPLVLQRPSPGTQLSLQPSKSSCTPPSALRLTFLLSPSFLPTWSFAFLLLQVPRCVSLNFYPS